MKDPNRISVCLVEDDADIVRAVQLALRHESMIDLDVALVTTPEALESLPVRLISGHYHVLLVDLGLPSHHPLDQRWKAGLDLLAALVVKQCESVPIVLTAYDEDAHRIDGARHGAQVLVAKKDLQTWKTLPLQVRTAHAYWTALNEQRKRRQEEYEHQSTARLVGLAASLAHDLAAPLAVFRGYMDLLRLGPGELTKDQFLAVDNAIEDAVAIASYLEHTLAKGQIEPTTAHIEATEWRLVFQQVERMARLVNRQHGEVARLSFASSFTGRAMLDRVLVNRVLNNLVITSITAMQNEQKRQGEGRLDVCGVTEDAWLVITLRDNAVRPQGWDSTSTTDPQISRSRDIVVNQHEGQMVLTSPNDMGGATVVLKFRLDIQ